MSKMFGFGRGAMPREAKGIPQDRAGPKVKTGKPLADKAAMQAGYTCLAKGVPADNGRRSKV